MAATALTPTLVTFDGVEETLAAANAAGNYFANNGYCFLVVKNGGDSSIDVTIDSQAKCNFGVDHDVTVAVANGKTLFIGPFNVARFNDANGDVQITYSDVTSVTVGVFRLR